jgi:hypothetical protein
VQGLRNALHRATQPPRQCGHCGSAFIAEGRGSGPRRLCLRCLAAGIRWCSGWTPDRAHAVRLDEIGSSKNVPHMLAQLRPPQTRQTSRRERPTPAPTVTSSGNERTRRNRRRTDPGQLVTFDGSETFTAN